MMRDSTRLTEFPSYSARARYCTLDGEGVPSNDFAPITLHDGALFVGDQEVANAHFAHNYVSWSHHVGGTFSNGVIYFNPDGSTSYAVIDQGDDRAQRSMSHSGPMHHQIIAAAPVPMTVASAQPLTANSTSKLRFSDLISLLPDAEVQEDTQGLLNEGMRWALAQCERTRPWLAFMGEQEPALHADHQAIIKESLWWYTDVYAVAVLTHSLQNLAQPPTVRLNSEQALAVKDFLKPSTGLSLVNSRHYALQNRKLYMLAYRQSRPNLQRFIDDKSTDWAAKLHEWLVTEQLERLVQDAASKVDRADAMTPINNWTTLLAVLDSTGNRAKTFQLRALQAFEAQVHVNLAGEVNQLDPDRLSDWLPDALQALLIEIAGGRAKIEGISSTQAQELQDFLIQEGAEFTSAVGAILTTLEAIHFDAQSAKFTETFRSQFMNRYPKLAFVSSIIVPLAVIGSLASVAMILRHTTWEKLSAREKTQVVYQIAQNVVALPMLGRAGMTFAKLMRHGALNFDVYLGKKVSWWEASNGSEQELYNFAAKGKDYASYGATELRDVVAQPGNFQPARGWARIMKDGKLAATTKIAGLALSWVLVGLSAWKLEEDVMNGESTEIIGLDAGALAATVLSAVFLTADLLIASAVLPWLAVGFAIIGAVLAIVEAFRPHRTPLDKFMASAGIPFSDGLLEKGATRWLFDDSQDNTSDDAVNSVDFRRMPLAKVQIRYDSTYGIVNLRFMGRNQNGELELFTPTHNFSCNDDEENPWANGSGWLTPDHSGGIFSSPLVDAAVDTINGIQFAKHQDMGLVNLRRSIGKTLTWLAWDTTLQNDETAEKLSQPRICETVLKMWTRRRAHFGIIDAHFEYDKRII